MSPPFPKGFPRGGGVYDQDPILMRDFRLIRKFEVDWKDAQQQAEASRAKLGQAATNPGQMKGGGLNLPELLDQLAEDS